MRLDSWMKDHNLEDGDLALMLGCASETVRRHRLGLRFPDHILLSKYIKVTKGEVTANDFYIVTLTHLNTSDISVKNNKLLKKRGRK